MSATTLLVTAHEALLGAGLPADVEEIPPADQTSPGLLGFLVTFAVAAAVIGLAFSLVRHLRVVERNARRLEAEEDAARAASDGEQGAAQAGPSAPAPGTLDAPTTPDVPGTPPADPR
jgi:hypothetical protein